MISDCQIARGFETPPRATEGLSPTLVAAKICGDPARGQMFIEIDALKRTNPVGVQCRPGDLEDNSEKVEIRREISLLKE